MSTETEKDLILLKEGGGLLSSIQSRHFPPLGQLWDRLTLCWPCYRHGRRVQQQLPKVQPVNVQPIPNPWPVSVVSVFTSYTCWIATFKKRGWVCLKRAISAVLRVISHHHSALRIYQSFRQQNGPYSVDWGWELQLLHTLCGGKEQHSPTASTHTHTVLPVCLMICFALIARPMPFKSFASVHSMQIQSRVLHWRWPWMQRADTAGSSSFLLMSHFLPDTLNKGERSANKRCHRVKMARILSLLLACCKNTLAVQPECAPIFISRISLDFVWYCHVWSDYFFLMHFIGTYWTFLHTTFMWQLLFTFTFQAKG